MPGERRLKFRKGEERMEEEGWTKYGGEEGARRNEKRKRKTWREVMGGNTE